MQTFLPYPDFERSARCLDRARLGKQRVEALQILRALLGLTKGWLNHPATRMWRGHEHALIDYGLAICAEWVRRGYRDTCADKIRELSWKLPETPPPPWLGNERFHASHRSALLRKLPEHYRQYGWRDYSPAYVWPV